MFAQIPQLTGVDRRLLDMIIPTSDLMTTTRYFTGEGAVDGWVGNQINKTLQLPEDGKPWQSAQRADMQVIRDANNQATTWVNWQTVNVVDGRASREEQRHMYTVMTMPDGSKKLALARRRTDITDSGGEIIDKTMNQYPVTTTRVKDWEKDTTFLHLAGRSPKLQELLASASPDKIQVVRTDMDRPFQQAFLEAGGARSHNYYALNTETGERVHLHFFDFGHSVPDGKLRAAKDRLIHGLFPDEMGIYEVSDFQAITRTETFDPVLTPGLSTYFAPGYADAYSRVGKLATSYDTVASNAFDQIVALLNPRKKRDVEPSVARVVEILAGLDKPRWLAVLKKLNSSSPKGKPLQTDGGKKSALYHLTETLSDRARGPLEAQMVQKLGLTPTDSKLAFSQVLRIR